MTPSSELPRGAHLVGSVALSSPRQLFRQAGAMLGARLKRVPDGEPGGRSLWISWQYPTLRASPFLKVHPAAPANPASGFRKLTLADGVSADEVRFAELGYAREARASYVDFRRARDAGELSPATRFQVCLPTPFACVFPFVTAEALGAVEPAYERAMRAELAMLFEEIPHADLALQWDVCIEMVIWDGRSSFYVPAWTRSREEEILSRMARICASVPDDVELGFHLCYGDWDAKHFIEPLDSGKMVELANALRTAVRHSIAYLHFPVPLARSDDAFFRPLEHLALEPHTEIYLGLLHPADGPEGAQRRVAAARNHLPSFGVATECGLGRCKTPENVSQILKLYADSSLPLD
jgi:hypothetical protein